MTAAKKLLIVVAIQMFVLAAVIGFKQYTVWTGETVVLATVPVDPRDPFRGDYATIRYDISRLHESELVGDDYVHGTVYVELQERDDGFWHAVAMHDERERSLPDTILIKGEVQRVDYAPPTCDRVPCSPAPVGAAYTIDYGIEEIFIPEGSGTDIPGGEGLGVEVKVDRFGNAVARGFVLNGEPVDLER
jgi:uncharacterized membrane-anchored protein